MTDQEFQRLVQQQLRQFEEDKHLTTMQAIAKRQHKQKPKIKRNK
jgi:hypothetical protein